MSYPRQTRYVVTPCPVLNSSYHFDDFGNRQYRFRRYASWMCRLFLKAEDQVWTTDDAINRLQSVNSDAQTYA